MSNKDEALRAKDLAEDWMKKSDYVTARRYALTAQKLDENLEKLPHMIMVCDVHCAALEKSGDETDFYKILQVQQDADDNIIKKQYKKLAVHLHPDKNKVPGAESAFKSIGEAQSILLNKDKRRLHDLRRKPPAPASQPQQAPANPFSQQSKVPTQEAGENSARMPSRKKSTRAKSSADAAENSNRKRKGKKVVEIIEISDSSAGEDSRFTGGQHSGRRSVRSKHGKRKTKENSSESSTTGAKYSFTETLPNGINKAKKMKKTKQEARNARKDSTSKRDGRNKAPHILNPKRYFIDCNNRFFYATSKSNRSNLVIPKETREEFTFGNTISVIDKMGETVRDIGSNWQSLWINGWNEVFKRSRANDGDVTICEITECSDKFVKQIKVHFVSK